jgi:hypothetical protein
MSERTDDDFDYDREFRDSMRRDHEAADETKRHFQQLLIDPCMIIPEVGDTVVVAAGPLGMGFDWVRHEAEVLVVGQASYKVRFIDYKSYRGEVVEMWIHPAVVTDVIHGKVEVKQ